MSRFKFNSVHPSERMIFFAVVALLLLAFVMTVINVLCQHYPGTISTLQLQSLPGICILYSFLVYLKGSPSRLVDCLKNLILSYLIFVMASIAAGALAQTPFSLVDSSIRHWDSWLGFNVTHWMAWVQQSAVWVKVLKRAYSTWLYQFFVVPFLLALWRQQETAYRYYLACLISFVMGGAIYFFFPTSAPATVYHSPYFTQMQHNLVTAFYQFHHHQKVTVPIEGLISFPSFHVIGAVLALIAVFRIPILFALFLVVNTLLIASTVLLGYHYLSDVLAGIVIALVAYRAAIWLQENSIKWKSY